MPKSQIPNISPATIQGGFNLPIPEGDPGQPYGVPKEGSVPNMNHSKNLPMTDNTRGSRKTRLIFDDKG